MESVAEMQSSATCQASPFGDWAKEDNFSRPPCLGFEAGR